MAHNLCGNVITYTKQKQFLLVETALISCPSFNMTHQVPHNKKLHSCSAAYFKLYVFREQTGRNKILNRVQQRLSGWPVSSTLTLQNVLCHCAICSNCNTSMDRYISGGTTSTNSRCSMSIHQIKMYLFIYNKSIKHENCTYRKRSRKSHITTITQNHLDNQSKRLHTAQRTLGSARLI
jgi:hypothetical protein